MPNPLLANLGHVHNALVDARRRLLDKAKAGDKEAREILRTRYRLRRWVAAGRKII